MQATWWEKTVEYGFILRLNAAGRLDFAAPIAGRHERSSGDGIFGKDKKLVLVEFKRDKSEIAAEKTIFTDYDVAANQLNHYNHHWIVYGGLTNEQKLGLGNQKYFDPNARSADLADILSMGITHPEFMNYLEQLQYYRSADGRGGGGHVSPESMLTVLGVSPSGKLVGSLSLEQYKHELKPAPPAPRNPPNSSPSLRPRGM
ncbi:MULTISPECIES: hypothetical protein [Pseudomonas]|uniref:hypothetical protein n=2 Tax=Pseudomonas TaxID=286 RepID=UPI000AD6E4D5|nr:MULTISPECIES: hypothetical protein [Pseudomonas]MBH3372754.1 hypothetical protein [Pseudomonas juntendi]MCE0756112.1 hypothetical protein [Pseudomonas asiatica]QKL03291.1 hypothetical protein GEV39_18815 [Pseudomonas sp. NY5710]QKL06159.1 hypothetical protein GEV41_06840 [Pseudomonas putida]QOH72922.1 hypothetical protein IGB31_11270 [Pseudomonas putida]